MEEYIQRTKNVLESRSLPLIAAVISDLEAELWYLQDSDKPFDPIELNRDCEIVRTCRDTAVDIFAQKTNLCLTEPDENLLVKRKIADNIKRFDKLKLQITRQEPKKPWLSRAGSLGTPGYYVGEGVGAPGPGEYEQWQELYDVWEVVYGRR